MGGFGRQADRGARVPTEHQGSTRTVRQGSGFDVGPAASPGMTQLRALSQQMNASTAVRQLQSMADELNADRRSPLKRRGEAGNTATNRTGLPDALKAGVEELSGVSMDNVRVHYNSPQPAQLQAHAYAQGADIHLGPGQERHLPHEAWHVVQQAQGRVRPTMQLQGKVSVNDDQGLEREADLMGARALAGPVQVTGPWQTTQADLTKILNSQPSVQRFQATFGVFSLRKSKLPGNIVQRVNYESNTIGVEQEISGYKLRCLDSDRGIIGDVRKSGNVLVEFTTDMGSHGEYTIELRTTPSEKSKEENINDRNVAMDIIVSAIKKAGNDARSVDEKDVDSKYKDEGFSISIMKHKHTIFREGDGRISFANQVSLGVPIDALAEEGDADVALIRSNAIWYQNGVEGIDFEGQNFEEKGKSEQAYRMVSSIIKFLSEMLRGAGEESVDEENNISMNIYDPSQKNKWGVLPRTPPWDWLKSLKEGDQSKVKKILKDRFSGDKYCIAAYNHIIYRKSLAGHQVPPAEINGKQSAIFEFRTVPNKLAKYVYGDERDYESPQNISTAKNDIMKELLMKSQIFKLRQKMQNTKDSDESDDES